MADYPEALLKSARKLLCDRFQIAHRALGSLITPPFTKTVDP